MSLRIESRALGIEDLEPAGTARLRAARSMNAGIGCVGLIALVVGVALLGGAVLIIWLTGAWRLTFWGVVLAGASLLLIIAGAAPFMIGLYALLSYVRKRVRLARHGWRSLVPSPGTPGCEVMTFDAHEAWVIDNHQGEPVGVWRVEDDAYLLAPTLEVEFVPEPRPSGLVLQHGREGAPGAGSDDGAESPRADWKMAWGGRVVVFPGRELGLLRLSGAPRPTPVLVPREEAYEDAGDLADLMTDALPHPRVLIAPLRELPRWVRLELLERSAAAGKTQHGAQDAASSPGAGEGNGGTGGGAGSARTN